MQGHVRIPATHPPLPASAHKKAAHPGTPHPLHPPHIDTPCIPSSRDIPHPHNRNNLTATGQKPGSPSPANPENNKNPPSEKETTPNRPAPSPAPCPANRKPGSSSGNTAKSTDLRQSMTGTGAALHPGNNLPSPPSRRQKHDSVHIPAPENRLPAAPNNPDGGHSNKQPCSVPGKKNAGNRSWYSYQATPEILKKQQGSRKAVS